MSFDLARVTSELATGEIIWSLHYEPVCDSTQDLARAAAVSGAAPGWTVTRNVTHVVPAMGMVPSVQPAVPAAYEPASSPVRSKS